MNVLRSTDHAGLSPRHLVSLNLAHLSERNLELFYSWIEIWLHRNCNAGWHMEMQERPVKHQTRPETHLCVTFADPREAIYFKMSPEYAHGQLPTVDHWYDTSIAA